MRRISGVIGFAAAACSLALDVAPARATELIRAEFLGLKSYARSDECDNSKPLAKGEWRGSILLDGEGINNDTVVCAFIKVEEREADRVWAATMKCVEDGDIWQETNIFERMGSDGSFKVKFADPEETIDFVPCNALEPLAAR